jgi:hypothetical protein
VIIDFLLVHSNDWFLLPATASSALQPGPTLEKVQFLQDEIPAWCGQSST